MIFSRKQEIIRSVTYLIYFRREKIWQKIQQIRHRAAIRWKISGMQSRVRDRTAMLSPEIKTAIRIPTLQEAAKLHRMRETTAITKPTARTVITAAIITEILRKLNSDFRPAVWRPQKMQPPLLFFNEEHAFTRNI